MNQKTFYTEIAYLLGLLILALGTAFMERADFGVSMVVAPAYLIHLKVSEVLPFFSFGMAEYALQAVVILAMILILRRIKLSYFFSFVTAVLYGLTLDGAMALIALLPEGSFGVKLGWFLFGMLLCSIGVSLLFHTYISPEAYELFVKEISAKLQKDIHKCKTAYDCVSCLIAILLSFLFFGFGHFEGVKLGTIFCALVNGSLIGRCTAWFDKRWDFQDGLPFRKYFQ